MARKINFRKTFPVLLEGIFERHHTLSDDAFVLGASIDSITGIVRNTLKNYCTKSTSLDDLSVMRDHLSDLVSGIMNSYNLTPDTAPSHNIEAKPKQDGYVTLFQLVTDAAEILPENERNKYFASMVEEVRADDTRAGEDYKLVPLFATEVLAKITKRGTSQQLWQAVNYLKSQRKSIKPAAQLISYDRCCPSTTRLTRQDLNGYNEEHQRRDISPDNVDTQLAIDADYFIDTYKISDVRRVSGNSGCFEVIAKNPSGNDQPYLVSNGGKQFSRPIVKLMTAVKERLQSSI